MKFDIDYKIFTPHNGTEKAHVFYTVQICFEESEIAKCLILIFLQT